MDEPLKIAADAVAACLRIMAEADANDVGMGEVLYMLARVLEHPQILE